jgi:hypothetical protein
MQNKRKIISLALLLLLPVVLFSLFYPQFVNANIFDDILSGARRFTIGDKKELTVEPTIALAPGGDVEKNGEIDAGDIVRFSFSIKNPTEKEYPFTTIDTKINRESINFIHNSHGTASIADDLKTIKIPNLRIHPGHEIVVSFDARINYSNEDQVISIEPELVDKDKKLIHKADKVTVKAIKLTEEKVPSSVELKVGKNEN